VAGAGGAGFRVPRRVLRLGHPRRLSGNTAEGKSLLDGSVADSGCLSRIRLFSIPDPGSELSPSRIPNPRSSSKNLSILTPKNPKKWFLSSKKYDPGCSSRIRMLTFYPSRIPDPEVKRHRIPDPQHWFLDDESLVQCVPCTMRPVITI
jgi:hypothetical protein